MEPTQQGTLSAWQTFWEMSDVAFGLLIVLLLAIQVVLVVAPLKWLQLRRLRLQEAVFEEQLDAAEDEASLHSALTYNANAPGARVMRRVLQASQRRVASYEELMGVARRALVLEQERCNRLMPTLAGIASTAPLLGLFGTVWGIIEAFLTIAAEKSSELPIIAPAMSGALLTTAFGLLAAIPATLVYNYVQAAIERLMDGVETTVQSWAGRLGRGGN